MGSPQSLVPKLVLGLITRLVCRYLVLPSGCRLPLVDVSIRTYQVPTYLVWSLGMKNVGVSEQEDYIG